MRVRVQGRSGLVCLMRVKVLVQGRSILVCSVRVKVVVVSLVWVAQVVKALLALVEKVVRDLVRGALGVREGVRAAAVMSLWRTVVTAVMSGRAHKRESERVSA